MTKYNNFYIFNIHYTKKILTALSSIVYNEDVDSIQRCDISRTLSR